MFHLRCVIILQITLQRCCGVEGTGVLHYMTGAVRCAVTSMAGREYVLCCVCVLSRCFMPPFNVSVLRGAVGGSSHSVTNPLLFHLFYVFCSALCVGCSHALNGKGYIV